MNAKQIRDILKHRYRLPKWALFFEITEKLGINSIRRADAIAVSLTTPEINIIGFEIKCNRSDWLNELKNPDKSNLFVNMCNEFYVVAPYDIINAEEIPTDWGHICPHHVRTLKKAPHRDILDNTERLNLFLVLLRRAAFQCEKFDAIQRIVDWSIYDLRKLDTIEQHG